MKSGRIPSQTRTTTCSALPFWAAPASTAASTPTRTTTQRHTYFITIDSQPATGGRIDKLGKVCRALSNGAGTARLRVCRAPATNAQTDALATFRLCAAAQLPSSLPPEFDRFTCRPARFGAARSSPEEGNRAQPDGLLEQHGTRGDGELAAAAHRFEKGAFGPDALFGFEMVQSGADRLGARIPFPDLNAQRRLANAGKHLFQLQPRREQSIRGPFAAQLAIGIQLDAQPFQAGRGENEAIDRRLLGEFF